MTATLTHQPHPPAVAPAVYVRRRLVLLALAVALAASAVLLISRIQHAGAELDGPPPAPPLYVVQPGDTLWSIAGKVAPSVDVREAVGQLRRAAGNSALVPGQRIEVPAGLRP